MRSIFCLIIVVLAGTAFGQGKPVSARAAYNVMNRHEGALGKLVKGVTANGQKGDTSPMSRSAFVLELKRVFDQAKPSFRWTPRHMRVVESVVRKYNSDPKVQGALLKLARYGCIAPVGPIVVGPGDTLTAKQLGDALAYFMVRISHLAHQPDSKWSPDLTFDTGS